MRRENRRLKTENRTKSIVYATGSIAVISVLTFIAFYIMFGGQKKENESSFSTAKVNTLVPNNSSIYFNSATEETSTEMGKSVNEVKSTLNNEIKNKTSNTVTETKTTTIKKEKPKQQDQTKKENTAKKEVENTTKEAEASKTEEKDPVFIKPVDGEILHEYAKDNLVYSETLKEWITHPGVDIKAERTSIVKSAADGRVSSIKNDPRYGLTVVVEHANGFKTVYSNLLTAEFVTEGEEITSGQTIGTIGNTATFEVLDEDHLHFEILKNNENVDPQIYIQE